MTRSENINFVYHEFKRFFRNVGVLLKTAEELFEPHGWKYMPRSRSTSAKRGPGESDRWMPRECFLWVANPNKEHLVVYLAVNLDNPYDLSGANSAMVTAGCFDFGVGNKCRDAWDYPYTTFHFLNPSRKDDGTPCEAIGSFVGHMHPKGYLIKRAMSLGRPLEEVTTSAELEKNIVSPFVQSILQW